MGFFDRFSAKKPESPRPAEPATGGPAPAAGAEKPAVSGGVMPRLVEARTRLEARDLEGAMAIYEEVLAGAGDRADVLVTISGDLGVRGHVPQIIELVAPRYDAHRHGPATGLNLLQAYLAARQPEAAQHLLDILFTLQRPELEDRLFGFSNAIAEIMAGNDQAEGVATSAEPTKVSLTTISKPMWFYGLEDIAGRLVPAKSGPARRVAFAQLAQVGIANYAEVQAKPEDEAARFARGFALWLAETFHASAGYDPVAAVGVTSTGHYAIFPVEWTAENVRQLSETSEQRLDFVVTGAVRDRHGDFELVVRIWEVKKFRELKAFQARWTPATAEESLRELHEKLRAYMEWRALPAGEGLAYAPPAAPRQHVLALGASLTLFLGEKKVLQPDQAALDTAPFLAAARADPENVRTQLALVTAVFRLRASGRDVPPDALRHVQEWLATPAAQAADVSALLVKFA